MSLDLMTVFLQLKLAVSSVQPPKGAGHQKRNPKKHPESLLVGHPGDYSGVSQTERMEKIRTILDYHITFSAKESELRFLLLFLWSWSPCMKNGQKTKKIISVCVRTFNQILRLQQTELWMDSGASQCTVPLNSDSSMWLAHLSPLTSRDSSNNWNKLLLYDWTIIS